MTSTDEIKSQINGANFIRADLHIHSYGENGSPDVKDDQMTPKNIIDLAINEGIKLISITDHNKIRNVFEAINYSIGKNICIIPGVELTTPDGHLLVYLPSFRSLEDFIGSLDFSPDRLVCRNTIVQCLNNAGALNGFGIASHIDLGSGFEIYMKGYTPFKEQILLNPNLLGLEISSIENESWFTDRDDNPDRKRMLNARRRNLNEDSTYDLAKIMASDAHQLSILGKNARGDKKITRLKMDALDYHSFKVAFIDSSARIRIEELIPISVPHFVGIKFDGGFLNNQVVQLSKNLTCIIGGRGAGKSTILESIRSSSGNAARETIVDNEVWPERITLLYEDESGRQHTFIKDKSKEILNADDPKNGITSLKIESFGQGETAETIQHCDRDPSVMIKFFDSFIDFNNLKNRDEDLQQKLLENQTVIERLTIDINTIPQIEKAKTNADEQVKALKAKNAREIVELEEGLANERALRQELISHLKTLVENIDHTFADRTVFDLVLSFKEEKVIIGKEEFKDVKSIVEQFSKIIDKHADTISKDAQEVVTKLKERLQAWKNKEKETQDKIETIRKEIEAKGGKLDLAFIRKVTKDASDFEIKLNELKIKKGELTKFLDDRKVLLQTRKEVKDEIFKKRYEFVYRVNENLKSTVVDFNISIKQSQGIYSPELSNLIKETMGWRTSQVPKADLITSAIPFQDLLIAINKNDSSLLQRIKSEDGSIVFSRPDSAQIIKSLQNQSVKFQIERCSYEDLPSITLTKSYLDETGKEIFQKREFSKLSLGQQQSILLSILLFSNRNCPLIIDQPEDNLDSEFIYKTLVKNLRKIKEQRQVIIATHNANIAVLGDAELIIPLKSTSDKSHILNRGSIDNDQTKKITCAILEGGEKAFIKRKEIYGL
jgi:ABC-type lipoprotein export system ATPase subunit/histidinol phosphatase-like PHP family hydrolase